MLLHKKETLIKYLLIFIVVANLILLIMPDLRLDEPFTISLIKHSYTQIVYADSFDVHPPLYYLILKLFLQLFTFWTNNIIIKIIFARIFSFICFLFTFYFLIKITYILNLQINGRLQLVFYLLFPSIVTYSLDIRMYQLATLLLVLEIYGLLRYKKHYSYGIIISIISLSLNFYVNYFAAVFGCSILFVEFIDYFIKNKNKACKVAISGLCSICLFIPCLKFALRQFRYVNSNHYSNFVGSSTIGDNMYSQLLGVFTGKGVNNKISLVISIFIFLLIILMIIYILYNFSNSYKILVFKLLISFVLGILPIVILSFITHPIIQWRYGFPLFSIIYFFLLIPINDIMLKSILIYKIKNILLILFIMILVVLNIKLDYNTYEGDVNSINNINITRNILFSKHKNIIMHTNTGKLIDYSTYLPQSSKKIFVTHKISMTDIFGRKNRILLKNVFSNIKLKN